MKEKLEAMLVQWRKFLAQAEEDGAQEEESAWRHAIDDVEEILKETA